MRGCIRLTFRVPRKVIVQVILVVLIVWYAYPRR